jgi:Glycosyl hydrolase family 79 C-terminal beta domain
VIPDRKTGGRRRGLPAWILLTTLIALLLATACGGGGGGGGKPPAPSPGKPIALGPNQAEVSVSGQAQTKAIPNEFFGLSTEFTTLPLVEAHQVLWEKVLYELAARGSVPVLPLRIGGDSAEHVRFEAVAPPWAFSPTKKLVDDTAEAISAAKLDVILNINTVSSTQHEAATWMRELWNRLLNVRGGGIAAFEIGNEPDIYDQGSWKRGIGLEGNAPDNPAGVAPADLPKEITASSFAKTFQTYADALHAAVPKVPVIAPALAEGTEHLDWIKALLQRRTQNLKVISVHIYPYSACASPGDPTYPTIHRILSEKATAGAAKTIRPAVELAQQNGLGVRLTEINSVTCGGLEGVSNTFATALWAPDALFELMNAGVEGINLHARVTSINRPFSFDQQGLETRPLLYGLMLFARMLGPGARLVPVDLRTGSPSQHLKVWAVKDDVSGVMGTGPSDWPESGEGTPFVQNPLKLLVINKGSRAVQVHLNLPSNSSAYVQRLQAPSVSSSSGVTLEGQQFNHQANWQGKLQLETLKPTGNGSYLVRASGYSAVLLTVPVPAGTLNSKPQPAAGPSPLFGYS